MREERHEQKEEERKGDGGVWGRRRDWRRSKRIEQRKVEEEGEDKTGGVEMRELIKVMERTKEIPPRS